MSLNSLQRENTKKELLANFELTGLTKSEIATDFKISQAKLEKIFELKEVKLEEPWILRNYLLEKVRQAKKKPVPFTALSGDWHKHWFLNSELIDKQEITEN